MKQLEKAELLNSITHGIGFIFAIIITIMLPKFALNNVQFYSLLIYGIGMQLMFGSSCIYHLTINSNVSNILKKVDHSMIFVFIFSTYLPISVYMNTPLAYVILLVVGIVCLIGIVLKIFFAGKYKKIFTLLYVLVGWAVVLELNDLIHMLQPIALTFLVIGGIIYTLGAIIYATTKTKYSHVVWHLFVMAACFCQFMCIYYLYI